MSTYFQWGEPQLFEVSTPSATSRSLAKDVASNANYRRVVCLLLLPREGMLCLSEDCTLPQKFHLVRNPPTRGGMALSTFIGQWHIVVETSFSAERSVRSLYLLLSCLAHYESL